MDYRFSWVAGAEQVARGDDLSHVVRRVIDGDEDRSQIRTVPVPCDFRGQVARVVDRERGERFVSWWNSSMHSCHALRYRARTSAASSHRAISDPIVGFVQNASRSSGTPM